MSSVFVACEEIEEQIESLLTSVTLSQTSLTLEVGGSATLTAVVVPSDKTVTWKSSDESVASVSSTGTVTGKSVGKATVTATTTDGAKSATCEVTVVAPSGNGNGNGDGGETETVAVTGVTVAPSAVTLKVGETASLTATVEPANATNKSVTWNSNNTSVATVSASGVVTAVSEGTAIIGCLTGSGAKSATCVVTVTNTTAKKYLTYNQRVPAYYYKLKVFGGDFDYDRVVAYDNKNLGQYTNPVHYYYDYNSFWIDYTNSGGYTYTHVLPNDFDCNHYWHTETGDCQACIEPASGMYFDSEWANRSIEWEYPLETFAGFVSVQMIKREIDGWGILARYCENHSGGSSLPDNKDVTLYFANKSEKVMDIMCDIFTWSAGGSDFTFWVDLSTGFTLKYEEKSKSNGTLIYGYEVTTLKVGTPSQEDWDNYHLRPQDGDTRGAFNDDCYDWYN
ncbi:MAG: Ig-like domain-containing protein [Bacteroidales bacterium]|nr:Ig-like domain-containing protein [Bacteroidales bacterium]